MTHYQLNGVAGQGEVEGQIAQLGTPNTEHHELVSLGRWSLHHQLISPWGAAIRLTKGNDSISFLAFMYDWRRSRDRASWGSTRLSVEIFRLIGMSRISCVKTELRLTSMIRESSKARPTKVPRILYQFSRALIK